MNDTDVHVLAHTHWYNVQEERKKIKESNDNYTAPWRNRNRSETKEKEYKLNFIGWRRRNKAVVWWVDFLLDWFNRNISNCLPGLPSRPLQRHRDVSWTLVSVPRPFAVYPNPTNHLECFDKSAVQCWEKLLQHDHPFSPMFRQRGGRSHRQNVSLRRTSLHVDRPNLLYFLNEATSDEASFFFAIDLTDEKDDGVWIC